MFGKTSARATQDTIGVAFFEYEPELVAKLEFNLMQVSHSDSSA